MAEVILGRREYRDKVYACWLGKNIGGTLGTPWECRKFVNDLTFYDPVPKEPLPNDDLDFQLVWLKMLEEKGTAFGLPDFASYWRKYLSAYPWNEYGLCMRNLERGLAPPVSGWFENYYVDEMGSPIRSEIWACIAPADPARAAALAWMDSAMDHAGGEGTWGEMFWAAVESAAFVVGDALTLIRIGLAMIPPASNISRVIREAVWCARHGVRWAEARDRIVNIYGNAQPCNAIQNHGFTILGWLYGSDFGDKLCKAVNCAYDTDCTGATLGSVLGIIGASAGIPKKWSAPVGKTIVLHKFTGKFNAPKTVEELTRRTVAVAEQFVAGRKGTVAFGAKTKLPRGLGEILSRNVEAMDAATRDVRAAVAVDRGVEITLHYHGDPVFYAGVARTVSVTCRKGGSAVAPAKVELEAPAGWRVANSGLERGAFAVTPRDFSERRQLRVRVRTGKAVYAASFTVLSPAEADGFPSATNVEYCPKCRGRRGSCICARA